MRLIIARRLLEGVTDMDNAAEVLIETRGSLGLITLNRPKALNALSLRHDRGDRGSADRLGP